MVRSFISDDEIREIGKHYGRLGRLPPLAFLQQVDCLQAAILRDSINKAARPAVIRAPRTRKVPPVSKERITELVELVEGYAKSTAPAAGSWRGLADEK